MALPLMVGLAGFQVISGFQQADMVKRQAALQAQIDEFNAKLSEYDAWQVEAYGQTQMAEYQQTIDKAAGAAKVSAAGAGVDLQSGSLSEVVKENEMIARSNLLEIENQARERALGYKNQARNIRLGSMMNQQQARIQQQSIITGSIAKGGASLYAGLAGAPKTASPSGYEIADPGSQSLTMSSPGSYLSGSSQDLAKTSGYLGLP